MEKATNTMEDKENKFIIELEKLTRKYGIVICGCGCCGSPRLDKINLTKESKLAGYGSDGRCDIVWISPNNSYDWDNYRNSIIK